MKRSFLLLFVSIMLIFSLTGCKKSFNDNTDDNNSAGNNGGQSNGDSNSGDNSGGESDGESARFSLANGKTVNIISDVAVNSKLMDAVKEKTGKKPIVFPTTSYVNANEIVIGDTYRDISKTAYNLLEKVKSTHSDAQTYLIYSDGASVAIAYNAYNYSDKYIIGYVCEYFAENFTDEDTLPIGILAEGEMDVIAYQEIKDSEVLDKAWENLAAEAGGGALGEETVAVLKKMYSLYSDSAVDWLADLFDPTTGGFYYSNSARDTSGYLPDIESTGQALTFLTGTGMTTSVYNSLSEEVRNKLIAFVKTRQDSNGYFYHPQWSRSKSDRNIKRLFRDVSYGEAVLKALRARPTYTTPNGMVGDGIVVGTQPTSSSLTGILGGSAALAVSDVIAVSDASVPTRLQNEANFRAYLATLNINASSYVVGSEIAGQVGAIKERDRVLKSQGANYSLVQILVEWLNSKCYSSTGHWKSVADSDGNNGLLKISDAYNKLGAALPYPEAAVRSAVACITNDEPALTVCYPYNTWFAVNNVFDNVTRHDPQNAARLISSIREELRGNVTETVEATYEKVRLFAKADGSFSYQPNKSASHSSNMPVAVPNTNEGDVNATFICICGTASGIFKALGYTYIPQFTESDMMRFNSRLYELITSERGVSISFDDGEDLDNFELTTIYNPDGIESDEPVEEKDVKLEVVDGALVLDSPLYHRDIIEVKRTGKSKGGKAVFEADVTVDVGSLGKDRGTWIYFVFHDSEKSTAEQATSYTPFYIQFLSDGTDHVKITNENKSETVTTLIKDNVKFTLRLEYYINSYGYNNTLIYIKPEGATSFTSMGRSTINASTTAPSPNDISLRIETQRQMDVKLTLDNVIFQSKKK